MAEPKLSKRSLEIAFDCVTEEFLQLGRGECFEPESNWREIAEKATAAAELKEAINRAN